MSNSERWARVATLQNANLTENTNQNNTTVHTVVQDNDQIHINITNVIPEKEESEPEEVTEDVSEDIDEKEDSGKADNVAEEYVDIVYDSLCDMIEDGHANLLDTATMVLGLMQLVEEYDDLTGSEKKSLILRVLEKYDELHPDDPNLITDSLSGFINVMVGIDRGELVIQIHPVKCLSACFGCSSAAMKKRRKNAKLRKKMMEKKRRLQEKQAALEKEMSKLK
jgi:hypothetical protein